MGFTFDDQGAAKGVASPIVEMEHLIAEDHSNSERIFPYLGGEELNADPQNLHNRYVIDFEYFPLCYERGLPDWSSMGQVERAASLKAGNVPEDYPGSVAANWPKLLQIVERLQKGKRASHSTAQWWHFERRRSRLYDEVRVHPKALCLSRVSPQFSIAQVDSHNVFADSCIAFAFSTLAPFANIQSRPHEIWARFFSSSMKDDLRYAPSDCFDTFPFPFGFETLPTLEVTGSTYHNHRAVLMVARNEGMTKTYNRFHDSNENSGDIQQLRELHAAMDRAVLEAYGWHDLAERAEPIFLDEIKEDDHTYQGRLFWPSEFRDEVLARLLALNAERHAEEVRLGIAPGMKGKKQGDDEEYDEE